MLMGAALAGRLASCSNRYMMERVTIPSSESPATHLLSEKDHTAHLCHIHCSRGACNMRWAIWGKLAGLLLH